MLAIVKAPTVDSDTLEHGRSMIDRGGPSFFWDLGVEESSNGSNYPYNTYIGPKVRT